MMTSDQKKKINVINELNKSAFVDMADLDTAN